MIHATGASALLAELQTHHRLHRLQCGGIGAGLHVEAWAMREAVSALSELCVIALEIDAHLELKQLIGHSATVQTQLADGTSITRSGLVRAAHKLGSDGGLARYRLSIVPWLWLATQQRRSQVFQHRTLEEIIECVLSPYTEHGSWRFSDEVTNFLAQVPSRIYCTQYQESDYGFLCRLLAEEGLSFRFEENAEVVHNHELVIFADSREQPFSEVSPVRYHRSSSQEQQDSIQMLVHSVYQSVGQISLSLWDVDRKHLVSASVPNRYSHASPHMLLTEYDDILGLDDQSRQIQRSDTLEHYAKLVMESVECHADRWQGQGTLRTLCSGQRLQIVGAPAMGVEANPQLFVTAVEHIGLNNLPVGGQRNTMVDSMGAASDYLVFSADLQTTSPLSEHDVLGVVTAVGRAPQGTPLLPDAGLLVQAQASGYANIFTAAPEQRPWRPAQASAQGTRLHPKTLMRGVHSAIVVGPQGQTRADKADEVYCNARGDIRLRFHWQEVQAASGSNSEDNRHTRWVRVAQAQAGPSMGWQWLPRIGQEVLVKFMNGDPDQPVVVGALYNGRGEGGVVPTPGGSQPNTTEAQAEDVYSLAHDGHSSAQENAIQGGATGGHAPAWHGASVGEQGHRNAAALTGFKSKEFGGEGFNHLLFDDTDQQLRVQLHSSTAHSQLTLGHIIHQQDNYRGSFRGLGFELRTDAYGAVRGGLGVVFSTYYGPEGIPLEPVGDVAGLLALVTQLNDLTTALHQAVQQHQAVGLSAHRGAHQPSASVADQHKAPIPALQQTVATTVNTDSLATAQHDAQTQQNATIEAFIPHLGDAVAAIAARGGLLTVTGQHLQLAAGETITLASTRHVNGVFAGAWRVHSGQALSVLAGASGPDHDDTGLRMTAGLGDINVQAQHDSIKLLSREALSVGSITENVDLAAAERIRIATAQGASITIADGNITFECPGTITYYAAMRNMSGPTFLSREMNNWPQTQYDETVFLKEHTGRPAANRKYEIHREDGAILQGISDAEGRIETQRSDLIGRFRIHILNE